MFTQQKKQLSEASRLHSKAAQRKRIARQRVTKRCQQFLGEPLNLLYPYAAGILVCASQLQNKATGVQRIPFMNIAKTSIGLWTLITRIRRIKEERAKTTDRLENRALTEQI